MCRAFARPAFPEQLLGLAGGGLPNSLSCNGSACAASIDESNGQHGIANHYDDDDDDDDPGVGGFVLLCGWVVGQVGRWAGG